MKKLITLLLFMLGWLGIQAQTTYTFDYTGSIVNWTVPAGVTKVTINAKGAQGGSNNQIAAAGGLGADITGTFLVTPGDVLKILVGGAGATSGSPSGGGGSFVATSGNVPMLVAGGGGGAGAGTAYSAASANASATTTANSGYHDSRGPTGNAAGGSAGSGTVVQVDLLQVEEDFIQMVLHPLATVEIVLQELVSHS